jgi:hypothetical protein
MLDLDAITKEIVEREARNKRNAIREKEAIKKYNADLVTYTTYQQMLKDGIIKRATAQHVEEAGYDDEI